MSAKPLFVVLFFIFMIWVFANGTIGKSDLSGSGQSVVAGASTSRDAGGGQMNVVQSWGNSPCSGTYTVRAGDTLSKIAAACRVSLNDLLRVNPTIWNPNLIKVGQKITINKSAPTATPIPETKASPTSKPSPTRIPGIAPGQKMDVEVNGLPPNADVQVWIGEVKGKQIPVETGKTDEIGHLKVSVTVPETARARETWMVTVNTVKRPKMSVTSAPFGIGSK